MFLDFINDMAKAYGRLAEEFFEEEKACEKNYECNKCKKEEKEEATPHSYFKKEYKRYEDGECVEHKEKVVKDGKVIKDIHDTKSLECKKEKPESKKYVKEEDIEYWKKRVYEAELVNHKLKAYLEETEKKLKEAREQLAKIKSMFD